MGRRMVSAWHPDKVFLQDALKQIRLDAQLKQSELAVRLKKPQSYVSKYESGERRLDLLEVRDICSVCGISLAKFVEHLEDLITTGGED